MFWCCCGHEPGSSIAEWRYLNFDEIETGSGDAISEQFGGSPSTVVFKLDGLTGQSRGYGAVAGIGEIPANLVAASLTFTGYTVFNPLQPGVSEPRLTLELSAIKYSLPCDYQDTSASKIDWTIPAVPRWWNGGLGLVLSTPDIANALNQITGDAGFNPVTDRVMLLMRPTDISTASLHWRQVAYSPLPIFTFST